MISFGNEFDALHSVAQNVAKNRNSSVIGRQDGEQVLRRIIEKENDIRMLGSLLRSYAGPHQTWLVTEKSTTCRDGQKRRANLQRKLCVQERHFRSSHGSRILQCRLPARAPPCIKGSAPPFVSGTNKETRLEQEYIKSDKSPRPF
jgi:hypothetical protein